MVNARSDSLQHAVTNSGNPPRKPLATVKAYQRTAIVTVKRQDRPLHRYRVSLKRYHILREWAALGGHRWRTSGAWMRSSFVASLWAEH